MSLHGVLSYPSVNLAQLVTKPVPAQPIHFSIHPKENFSLQNPSISCRIGNTQISKNLSEVRLVVTKKDSIERQRRQTNTCTSDTSNRVYLGQNNLTRCLEQNNGKAFFFVENIDFSQLPQAEQNKFPLYSSSNPFSGNLTMPPFSLNNFNITRSEKAAFFYALANSNVNANFSNVDLTTTEVSTNRLAILTTIIQDHNAIILEIDSAKLHAQYTHILSRVSGVAAQAKPSSYGSIVFKIKERLTIIAEKGDRLSTASIVLGLIDESNIPHNITVLGNEIIMECEGIVSCGGAIGAFSISLDAIAQSEEYVHFIDVNANSINITNLPYHSMAIKSSIIVSSKFFITNNFFRFRAYVNHWIVQGGGYVGSIAEIDSDISTISPQQTIIISNIQVDLNATDANALGIAYAPNLQHSPTILLLSGNGTLASPNHLLFPHGSCSTSLIDWSGVSFNTQNVGCANAVLVESTTPSGWRTAHHRLAQQICADDPHACHYVNEVPLALVKGNDDNTFFVVSQQTHPYNNTIITGQGPIRVTQWNWDDLSATPRINTDFAVNGTQLYSANSQIFPASSPLSVSVDSQHVFMLFDEVGTTLVSLPLTMNQDTSYQIQAIEHLKINPVQLAGKDLWIQIEDTLRLSTIFSDLNNPSLSIPLGMNNTAVGVTQTKNYIYVAYTMDVDGVDTTHALRFLADGTLDNTWQATLSEHDQYRHRQLNVRGDENDPQVNLPLVSEVIHNASPDGKALAVLLPPRGGYGDWRYGKKAQRSTSIITPPITEPTDSTNPTDSSEKPASTSNGTFGAGENNNNNSNAASAASVVILVPIAIVGAAGALGAKILYNKLRSKKVELGEEAAKANKSTETVELTTVASEVSQPIEANQTGAEDIDTASQSGESNKTD